MAMITHQVSKETFIPEKNYFKCENVSISREETTEEIELYNAGIIWDNRGMFAIGIGVLLAFICGIVFGILIEYNSWFVIGVIFGFVCFVGGIIFANTACWPREHKAKEALIQWHKENDEALWAEAYAPILAYNEEQKQIAEAWRAEHPLEEKIRACIKDPMSSVDIANLARYYAEEYIKEGVSRETLD